MSDAKWIWRSGGESCPRNAFTWFRKVVDLPSLPGRPELRFSANSNARLLINGQVVRRKVSRYMEDRVTCDVVEVGPWLRVGRNVILVEHHNWGPVVTFQRTGNSHAGLYIASEWLNTDESWLWMPVPQMLEQEEQIIGVVGSAPRIRYGLRMDVRLGMDASAPDLDDYDWRKAAVITEQPWSSKAPVPAETRRQREYFLPVESVVNAGRSESTTAGESAPGRISRALKEGTCIPDGSLHAAARSLANSGAVLVEGTGGASRFLCLGFHQPIHGFPVMEFDSDVDGVMVDFVYTESPRLLYDGRMLVKPDGWLDPEAIVGKGYTDRVILGKGHHRVEIPEERTARWFAVHLHFPESGTVRISGAGFIKSQYTIKPIGTFECGDPQVDRIIRLMLVHAEVTMTDCYVDTPGREDGQWIEDSQLRAVVSARWFGENDLRRFLVRSHIESQMPDGNTHPFAPSNYPVGGATYDWSMQWVTALFEEYEWTGSTDLIQEHWPSLRKYMEMLLSMMDEEGIWRTNHLLADIRTGTGLTAPHQSSGLVTPMVHQKLLQSAAMARMIGEEDCARHWTYCAEKISKAYCRNHVVTTEGGLPYIKSVHDDRGDDSCFPLSQAAHTIAIFSGIVPLELAIKLVDFAYPEPDGSPPPNVQRWNNPTWFYRALKALSHVGKADRAVAHLKERCSVYLPGHVRNPVDANLQGPLGGPLPEYWVGREDLNLKTGEINTAQPEDDTGSHGWGAVPLAWIHEYLLGVCIAKPGGAELHIAPDPGGLPFISGWTVTPRGPVHVYHDPQDFRLEVILPADVTAAITPPPAFRDRRQRIVEGSIPGSVGDGKIYHVVGPGRFMLECW